MILVLLPCTVHYCFQPLILCSWAMKLCSGLKCSTEKVLSACSMVQDVPRGCPVNSSALLAAASQQSCSAIPTTLTLPASACRISTAVLLHPWQWCKVAVTAVFKHCAVWRASKEPTELEQKSLCCFYLKKSSSLLVVISKPQLWALYYLYEGITEHIVIIIFKVIKQLTPPQSMYLVDLLKIPPLFLSYHQNMIKQKQNIWF